MDGVRIDVDTDYVWSFVRGAEGLGCRLLDLSLWVGGEVTVEEGGYGVATLRLRLRLGICGFFRTGRRICWSESLWKRRCDQIGRVVCKGLEGTEAGDQNVDFTRLSLGWIYRGLGSGEMCFEEGSLRPCVAHDEAGIDDFVDETLSCSATRMYWDVSYLLQYFIIVA